MRPRRTLYGRPDRIPRYAWPVHPTTPATELANEFRQRFGSDSELLVRAPGRVNLIGEHTDYSHLPVLPAAIDRALYLAASRLPGGLIEGYSLSQAARFESLRSAPRVRGHDWGRYAAGVLEELLPYGGSQGIRVLIGGDLPATGGLSSSSALSVGFAFACARLWDITIDRASLADLAARAERRVGVETGGMDQLVIALGTAGHALRIDFEPVACRSVALPPELQVVVASSGEAAPKGGRVRDAYNERVIGTRLAAALLADQLGLEAGSPPRLRDIAADPVADLLVDDLPEAITAREVAHGVGARLEELVSLTATTYDPRARVPVRRYARHVLAEARRVDDMEAALTAGDLAAAGNLLDRSHDSLRQDFNCSTHALDALCKAMRKAGALGARLTGAGFGGFALAFCTAESLPAVITAAEAATGGPAFEVKAADGVAEA